MCALLLGTGEPLTMDIIYYLLRLILCISTRIKLTSFTRDKTIQIPILFGSLLRVEALLIISGILPLVLTSYLLLY